MFNQRHLNVVASMAVFMAIFLIPAMVLAEQRASPADMRSAYTKLIEEAMPKALEIADAAAESSDPFMRANAIEALMPMTERAMLYVQEGVDDPTSVVRFVSLVAAGDLGLQSLGRRAVQMAESDPSRNVRAAALYAAKKTGQDVDFSPMAQLLASDDPGVRRNTVMLLGMLGDRSAVPMIRQLVQIPMRRANPQEQELVQIEAAKALVLLGDEESIEVIEAGAFSNYGEVRVLSVLALGELDDRRMQPALERMLDIGLPEQAPEVRLAAAEALAQMGQSSGLPVLVDAADSRYFSFDGRQIPTDLLRVQAARGLGMIQDVRSAQALTRLLEDPNPMVRLSAAGAVINAESRLRAGRRR